VENVQQCKVGSDEVRDDLLSAKLEGGRKLAEVEVKNAT